MLPIIGHLTRKIVPGNPTLIEGMSIIPLFFIGIWSLLKINSIPKWISVPIVIWAVAQLVYALIGLFKDPMIALGAAGIRIVPLLMVPIAYMSLKTIQDITRITRILGVLAILFAGLSIYVAIYGEYALPKLLKPIDYIADHGIPVLKGMYYTATAIFSTPTQLGFFGLIAFVLSILALLGATKKYRVLYIISLLSSFLVLYLSGRRILTYYSIIIFLFSFYRRKWFPKLIIIGLIGLSILFWIDNHTEILSKRGDKRLIYLVRPDNPGDSIIKSIQDRVNKYAINYTFYHLKNAPLGSFLGSYGPEARAFSYNKTRWTDEGTAIESGSTLLAAEMGWIGIILFPVILLYIIYQIYYRSKDNQNKTSIRILVIFFGLFIFNFMSKGYTVIMSNQIQALFFWSIPGICAALTDRPDRNNKYILLNGNYENNNNH